MSRFDWRDNGRARFSSNDGVATASAYVREPGGFGDLMFVSFFPRPFAFFPSAAAWTAVTVLLW